MGTVAKRAYLWHEAHTRAAYSSELEEATGASRNAAAKSGTTSSP